MLLLSTTSNLNFPAEIVDDMCHFCGLDHLKKDILNDYYYYWSCGIFVMIQHIFMNLLQLLLGKKFNFTEKIIATKSAKSAQQQPIPAPPTPPPLPPLSKNNNNVVEVS